MKNGKEIEKEMAAIQTKIENLHFSRIRKVINNSLRWLPQGGKKRG